MDYGHAALVAERPEGLCGAADADLDRALRVQRAFLDCPAEGSAMMVLVPEQFGTGIAVGIEMNHPERPESLRQRAHDGQGDGMIAPGRQRRDSGIDDLVVPGFDFGNRPFQVVDPLNGHVAEVRGLDELVRLHAGLVVVGPHQRGLVAEMARTVACARAIGDRSVEGHAEESDVDAGPVFRLLQQGPAQEGRHTRVSKPELFTPRLTALVGHTRPPVLVIAHGLSRDTAIGPTVPAS